MCQFLLRKERARIYSDADNVMNAFNIYSPVKNDTVLKQGQYCEVAETLRDPLVEKTKSESHRAYCYSPLSLRILVCPVFFSMYSCRGTRNSVI